MEIGNRIRELRQERGLTQRELGRRAGLSHGAVSHLELGIRMPAAATVAKIARALGIDPGELYREPVGGPVPLAVAPSASDERVRREPIGETAKLGDVVSDQRLEEVQSEMNRLFEQLRSGEITYNAYSARLHGELLPSLFAAIDRSSTEAG